MMCNPLLALGWEFWRPGGPRLLLAWLVSLAIPSLFFSEMWLRSIPAGGAATFLQYAFLVVALPTVTFATFVAAGEARRKFVLPLRGASIAGWMFVQVAAAAVATVVTAGWVMNGLFDAQWPLVKPALALAAAACCSFAIFWPLGISDLLRKGLGVLCAAGCAVVLVWSSAWRGGGVLEGWNAVEGAEWVLAALILAGSAAVAVWNFARARRGGDLPLAVPVRQTWERLAACWPEGGLHSSAVAAELWYEWREKGIVLPCAVAALGSAGLLPWLVFAAPVEIVDAGSTLAGMSGWLVLISFAFGFFLGSTGPRGGLGSFKASRPLADTTLADSILVNVARSVLAAWAVWTLLIGAAGGWLWAAGRPVSLSGSLPFIWCGLILASWALSSNAAVLMLLPQRVAGAIVVGAMVLPSLVHLFFQFVVPARYSEPISLALGWLLLVGLFVAALLVLLVCRLRQLASGRRLGMVAGLVAVTLAGLHAAVLLAQPTGASQHVPTLATGFLLALATYAWLPLAAAPLAVFWTRHR